jgi:iodotyrosine deiodinase
MTKPDFIPYAIPKLTEKETLEKSKEYYQWINKRRSVRDFSSTPIPKEVVDNIVLSASCAPSGANRQPWTFCVVGSAEMKSKIRVAAEKEEVENYESRMSDRWKKDLAHLGTNHIKPFLEEAPWLIIVFKRAYEIENEEKINNYYVTESVGLACGFLLTAIYQAGLIALTHTPSPMNFLSKLLNRPENERPFLLIPIGYPAENTSVPNIQRKPLEKIIHYY